MRITLALLLSFLLINGQAFALSGGPNYGNIGTANLVGTYAGVLIPEGVAEQAGSETPAPEDATSASVGIFSFAVGEQGFATGSLIVFVAGTSFLGDLTAVVDPSAGSIQAIIDATSTYQVQRFEQTGFDDKGRPEFEKVSRSIFCQGSLQAEIDSDSESGARLEGTATVDIFGSINLLTDSPIITRTARFTVDGFKQSDTAVASQIQFGGGNI